MGEVYERLPCDIKQKINKLFWDDIHVLSRRLLILMRNKVMRINQITEDMTLGLIGTGLEKYFENIIKIELIECIHISRAKYEKGKAYFTLSKPCADCTKCVQRTKAKAIY